MANSEKKPLSQKVLSFFGGVVLLLASLLLFLAPRTHLYFFDTIQVYLFGNPGYYGISAFAAILGIGVIVSGFHPIPKKLKRKIGFSYLFIFLGSCLLCGYLSPLETNLESPSVYNEAFNAVSYLGKGFGLEPTLGGGIFAYYVLSLLRLVPFAPLTIIVLSLLFTIAAFIWLWPLLGILLKKIGKEIKKSKENRKRDFLEKAFEEEKRILDGEEKEEEVEESKPVVEETPTLNEPTLVRRRDLKEKETAPETKTVVEEAPAPTKVAEETSTKESHFVPYQSMVSGEMKEAVFSFGEDEDAFKEDTSSKYQPMDFNEVFAKEEPAPAVTPVSEPESIEPPEVEETPIEDATPVVPQAPKVDPFEEDRIAREKLREEAEKKKEEEAKKAAIKYVYFGEDRIKAVEKRSAPYRLPDAESMLMDYPPDSNAEDNRKEAEERKARINLVFANFGVDAQCVSYTIGPSVTCYYISLGPTTQIRAVRALIETLQVKMGGVHALFREMIKGSDYCGLEVANSKTSLVSFKDCVLGIPADEKHKLYVPFGKSIEGKIVSGSVARFPHMLVAGGTGSGKSIFVHGIISTLLMHNSPDDLKFLFIDKKRIELGKYEGIPHLLCPVVKETLEAKKALEKLVAEMNRRNRILDAAGRISDIDEFNADVAPARGCEKLPHIVAIIDEYAELVDTCKEINEPVASLTQLARSAGIHLIVATQHPTVDVINGRIKSNIGTRVGLKVTNATDSMTVLNAGGAEKLNGHGDMLVDCMEVNEPGVFARLQGCLINKKEIASIVDFHKAQRAFVCDPEFENLHEEEAVAPSLDAALPSAAENRAASEEQLYEQIKESVMKREYVSISAFQREYALGFGKAGRMFDRLKRDGIIEPNGTSNKGSRVLIHDYAPTSEN